MLYHPRLHLVARREAQSEDTRSLLQDVLRQQHYRLKHLRRPELLEQVEVQLEKKTISSLPSLSSDRSTTSNRASSIRNSLPVTSQRYYCALLRPDECPSCASSDSSSVPGSRESTNRCTPLHSQHKRYSTSQVKE